MVSIADTPKEIPSALPPNQEKNVCLMLLPVDLSLKVEMSGLPSPQDGAARVAASGG
jgi:hypothetical protein